MKIHDPIGLELAASRERAKIDGLKLSYPARVQRDPRFPNNAQKVEIVAKLSARQFEEIAFGPALNSVPHEDTSNKGDRGQATITPMLHVRCCHHRLHQGRQRHNSVCSACRDFLLPVEGCA